jgi:hypothetical protein
VRGRTGRCGEIAGVFPGDRVAPARTGTVLRRLGAPDRELVEGVGALLRFRVGT